MSVHKQNEAHRVARELARLGATEVWMFGSQANGRAHLASDTDLIAIGPRGLRERLAGADGWPSFDIFVNVAGNGTFRSPWRRKAGSFRKWQCTQLSDTEAIYMGSHPSRNGNPNESDSCCQRAIRLYPCPLANHVAQANGESWEVG